MKPILLDVQIPTWVEDIRTLVQDKTSYHLWESLYNHQVETQNLLFARELDTQLTRDKMESFSDRFQREVHYALETKLLGRLL